jgi:hypothetical protein
MISYLPLAADLEPFARLDWIDCAPRHTPLVLTGRTQRPASDWGHIKFSRTEQPREAEVKLLVRL